MLGHLFNRYLERLLRVRAAREGHAWETVTQTPGRLGPHPADRVSQLGEGKHALARLRFKMTHQFTHVPGKSRLLQRSSCTINDILPNETTLGSLHALGPGPTPARHQPSGCCSLATVVKGSSSCSVTRRENPRN